jgi:preprotein translocase subunit SecG
MHIMVVVVVVVVVVLMMMQLMSNGFHNSFGQQVRTE